MKRVGKLIGPSVTEAYKNAHLLIGMYVQVRDGLDRMTRNLKKKIMNLGKLIGGNSRISTPLNGSTGEI